MALSFIYATIFFFKISHLKTINVLVSTPSHLEEVLREQIPQGQPRTGIPWKKIIVAVEGIYSLDGELCKLPEIITICKKYKVVLAVYFLFFL